MRELGESLFFYPRKDDFVPNVVFPAVALYERFNHLQFEADPCVKYQTIFFSAKLH